MLARLLTATAEWLACPSGFFISQGVGFSFLPAGFLFGFSDAWQLAWTLFLSVATFTIGGVILVAQNRDERAIQQKLDEVLRAIPAADNSLIGIERDG